MKKVQSKRLTLGKMTVANLNQQQMRFFKGGADTDDTTKQATVPTFDLTRSLVDEPNNQCGGPRPVRTTTP
jgi:natural product precursor